MMMISEAGGTKSLSQQNMKLQNTIVIDNIYVYIFVYTQNITI